MDTTDGYHCADGLRLANTFKDNFFSLPSEFSLSLPYLGLFEAPKIGSLVTNVPKIPSRSGKHLTLVGVYPRPFC